MKSLMDAGYAQGVLPPQQRPDLGALRDLGCNMGKGELKKELDAYSLDTELILGVQ